MTGSEAFRGCLSDIEVAAGQVRRAMGESAELRTAAHFVEQALEEAQHQATNATLNPDGSHGRRYLANVTEQCEIVRQRASVAANLAGRIEERLDVASVHAKLAREKQDRAIGDADSPGIAAMEHAYLHAAINHLTEQIALALPLARSARLNLERAASTAAALLDPDMSESLRRFTIFQVDRGVQTTARAFDRADEASAHLERTVERTRATATGTRMRAEHIAERLPLLRISRSSPLPPSGPSR